MSCVQAHEVRSSFVQCPLTNTNITIPPAGTPEGPRGRLQGINLQDRNIYQPPTEGLEPARLPAGLPKCGTSTGLCRGARHLSSWRILHCAEMQHVFYLPLPCLLKSVKPAEDSAIAERSLLKAACVIGKPGRQLRQSTNSQKLDTETNSVDS